jgi:hypothetical protein
VHGKEHQDSPPNESLMAATSARALLMIWSCQQREMGQKRKRKKGESEREVDVFKKGQTCLIYGNAIDQTSRTVRLRRAASSERATSDEPFLHGNQSTRAARAATSGAGWPPLCSVRDPATLGARASYVVFTSTTERLQLWTRTDKS